MIDNNQGDIQDEIQTPAHPDAQEGTPVYRKPILRKYDQIEQVKPYGPSELEAG